MLEDVCREIDGELRSRPEFAHTSHFLVTVDGAVVHDSHFHGPRVADTFSVTKSVLGTLYGIAVREGAIRDLDLPVGNGRTLRHLLTMTGGTEIDIDEIMALSSGWLSRIAAAPLLSPPGTTFRYCGGAAHLAASILAERVGGLSEYAASRLFGPLGIVEWEWPKDPDGLEYGFGHLRLSAVGLAALGVLWLDGGAWRGVQLMDPDYARAMVTPQTPGGPPEHAGYGHLLWVDRHGPFAAGWAGQHVTVVPAARAVVVTTGDPRFDPGPPPTAQLAADWRPARDLIVERLLPVLKSQ